MRSRRILAIATLVVAGVFSPALGQAADPQQAPPAPKQTPVCGRDLMTPQEMAEYRAKMMSAKTPEQRQDFMAAHHAAMIARAKERGVTLNPAGCPPARASMHRGRGMGMGMSGSPTPPTPPPAPAPSPPKP
jgi:Spy/CpxP family protein refolding chaperone